MKRRMLAAMGVLALGLGVIGACSSDDDDISGGASGGTGGTGSPEQTGSVCEQATDCYPDVDGGLVGEAVCLDRVEGGYCTHLCEKDEDCCAAPGECATGLKQVCSPFESSGQKMCFLSCEAVDMKPYDGGTAWDDDNEFCQREASQEFICRSSGGGSDNRKVCVPGDCGVGEACLTKADCNGDLECLTDVDGGYCGKANCTANADCPNGSACVRMDETRSYCLRKCQGDSDCSFCRPWDDRTPCTDEVDYVEDGTPGRVCVPTLL
jgi:hypothetical protein